MIQHRTILGCRLDLVDATEAVDRIVALALAGTSAQVVTLGTEMVVAARRDPAFLALVNASSLNVCDTVGLL
ncbi:MAG: WecB/TagA/CpsF family glycosyltransferase, partial [Vulcanimicrobiaceae bacterium]